MSVERSDQGNKILDPTRHSLWPGLSLDLEYCVTSSFSLLTPIHLTQDMQMYGSDSEEQHELEVKSLMTIRQCPGFDDLTNGEGKLYKKILTSGTAGTKPGKSSSMTRSISYI